MIDVKAQNTHFVHLGHVQMIVDQFADSIGCTAEAWCTVVVIFLYAWFLKQVASFAFGGS